MALKPVLETLEGLEEPIAKLYVEKDGKFHLDVEAHDSGNAPDNGGNWIPKTRFNEVNEKRKAAEETLKGVVDELLEDIPEDMRDIIPSLPPAEQIKWIRNAQKKGLFGSQQNTNGLDSKRPAGKQPADFEGMSPQSIMEKGYKS